MKIAVAKGDGIGPEIMEAVLKIFNANKVPIEYEYVDMGKWVFDRNAVSKHILGLHRVAVVLLVERFYTHFHTL